MSKEDFKVIRPHIAQIAVCRNGGLTEEGVAACWIGHRIQPLQQRINLGFEYIGPEDPAGVTKEGLSDAELLDRLQHMFTHLKELST